MPVLGDYAILGNWKMHLNTADATALAAAIAQSAAPLDTAAVTVGIAPAFVHLLPVAQVLAESAVLLGGQDCHAQAQGAFTGDVSVEMLADAGCGFVLAGHSERRQHHHETDAQVKAKAEAAIAGGLHAVVCVGETAEQRESGTQLDVIAAQLRGALPSAVRRENVTVAYEPVWAIGTGKTADTDDITAMHAHIRNMLAEIMGGQGAETLPRVLYGGSVKANNALDILSLPVVDGVLVGGASLDAHAFDAILKAAEITAKKR